MLESLLWLDDIALYFLIHKHKIRYILYVFMIVKTTLLDTYPIN